MVVCIALFLCTATGCWRQAEEPAPGCQPEGGIQCTENVLNICKNGALFKAGTCQGGCQTKGREARCFDQSKSLVAPIGAACQEGMALCGMTPNTLLVCDKGTLQLAGECPGGCIDRGDGSMLYCANKDNDLRFAEGMGCSGLGEPFQLACGMDGKTVLKCQDNYYVKHASNCYICSQQHDGQLSCANDLMERIDVVTDSAPVTTP